MYTVYKVWIDTIGRFRYIYLLRFIVVKNRKLIIVDVIRKSFILFLFLYVSSVSHAYTPRPFTMKPNPFGVGLRLYYNLTNVNGASPKWINEH